MLFFKAKIRALISYTIILTLVLLIYALILFIQQNGQATKEVAFFITLGVFLICGIMSGRFEKQRGWLAGLTSGICFILLNLLIIWVGKMALDLSFALKEVIGLITCTFGGMIGVNLRREKRIKK